MRMLFVFVLTCLMSMSAMAGFEGLNQGVSLKLFNRLDCSEGLECSKFKDKFIVKVKTEGVVQTQNAAVAGALTSEACGTTLVNTGAVEVTLPTPVVGCKVTFVTGNASNFDINPGTGVQILNLTASAGSIVRNATLGNSVTLQAVSSTQWVVVAI